MSQALSTRTVIMTLLSIVVSAGPAAAEALQPWELLGDVPEGVAGYMTATDSHMYIYGGSGEQPKMAELLPNGQLGPFSSTGSDVGEIRGGIAFTATDSHVYAVGGNLHGFYGGSRVEYATIQPDGSLSPWQQTSSLGITRRSGSAVVHNGYVYAVGGYTYHSNNWPTACEYAQIQPDGSLGPWQQTSAMHQGRPQSSVVVADGYVYTFGGGIHGTMLNSVERAEILPDGSLGPWQWDRAMPFGRATTASVAVDGDTIYLIGGHTGTYGNNPTTSVIYAQIQPDHSLGPWIATEPTLDGSGSGMVTGTAIGQRIYAVDWQHIHTTLTESGEPVPEPATMLAGLAGLAGVGRYLRKRK